MEGILILAHGSKRTETERILDSLTVKVTKKTVKQLVASAYLQFSEQNLERGIQRLADQGATVIKIMPMFLFDGVHVTEDIPNELEQIRKKYPHIQLTLTGHIGDDDRIADIIADRVKGI